MKCVPEGMRHMRVVYIFCGSGSPAFLEVSAAFSTKLPGNYRLISLNYRIISDETSTEIVLFQTLTSISSGFPLGNSRDLLQVERQRAQLAFHRGETGADGLGAQVRAGGNRCGGCERNEQRAILFVHHDADQIAGLRQDQIAARRIELADGESFNNTGTIHLQITAIRRVQREPALAII